MSHTSSNHPNMQNSPSQSTSSHLPLTYVKLILAKVSFEPSLFKRELVKATTGLLPSDLKSLEQWCYRRFGDIYGALLDECFSNRPMSMA